MESIDAFLALYDRQGGRWYGGERVSQAEHALQCATLAAESGAAPSLVVAALLHDIGHLVDFPEDAASRGIDDRHEEKAAMLLSRIFGPAVTEPIRLHVPAKRYLCRAEPGYAETLSPASVLSLKLQGGVFAPDEANAFIARPHAADAVKLRRWDEQAKVVGKATPGFAHFRPFIERCAEA